MVLPNQLIQVCIVPQNIEHYRKIGLDVNIRDRIEVSPDQLPFNSHCRVQVKCDNCGKLLGENGITWQKYHEHHGKEYGDLCYQCSMKIKHPDTCLKKYGTTSVCSNKEVRQKMQETNLKKYGVKNVFESQKFQDKIKETNLSKYGAKNPFASPDIKEKIKSTNLKKYGFDNPSKNSEIIQKIKDNVFAKYGVDNVFKLDWVRKKSWEAQKKLHINKYSKKQLELFNTLCDIYGKNSCEFEFTCSKYSLDCLLNINGSKIDVEYDGEYWHAGKEEKDKIRNEFLINRNYRIIRIKSRYLLPTKEELVKAVNYVTQYQNFYYEIILKDSKYYKENI